MTGSDNSDLNVRRKEAIKGAIGVGATVVVLLAIFVLNQFYPNHPVVWWLWKLLWLVGLPVAIYFTVIAPKKKGKW